MEYIYGFFISLISLVLNILVGLWIDHKTKEDVRRKKAIATLSLLKKEINYNICLLKQIQHEIKANTIIYSNLVVNIWKAISLHEFEGIISHELLHKVFRIYYEYERMCREIDMQFNMCYSVIRVTKGYLQRRGKIVKDILTHASILKKESEEIVKQIECELKKLSMN